MPFMLSDGPVASDCKVQFTLTGFEPMRVVTVPVPFQLPDNEDKNGVSSAMACDARKPVASAAMLINLHVIGVFLVAGCERRAMSIVPAAAIVIGHSNHNRGGAFLASCISCHPESHS